MNNSAQKKHIQVICWNILNPDPDFVKISLRMRKCVKLRNNRTNPPSIVNGFYSLQPIM